jgi:probable addiction module antidote protein
MISEKKKKDLGIKEWNVLDHLETDEDIRLFIQAAYDEGDYDYFLSAVGTAAKARGINDMARKMGVNRESLYKSLSGKRNPRFETVMKAIEAFGLKVNFVAANPSARA